MKVRWFYQSLEDLQLAVAYIREDNPSAARRLYEIVRKQVSVLARYPEFGRTGRVEGTRELVITGWPYIVVYHIKDQEVRILRVRHAAQEWPESFPTEEE
jgi:toxin ParE1/3/4